MVIETRDLILGYKNFSIVTDINIDIAEGEFIGIFGPNGSGKSTFLKTIIGLIPPLGGSILLFGKSSKKIKKNIGYMPQMRYNPSMINLSCRAMIEAAIEGKRFGLPFLTKKQKKRVQQTIDLVNASEFADKPIKNLSGGERQRIFLAQALLDNPRILLLDEPLSNLDPKYQENFINLLNNIQKEIKVTILFTAHDPNPLLSVMTKVLYFANKKALLGTPDEIITSKMLSNLYGTPIEVFHYKGRLIVLGEDRSMVHHHG